MRRRSLIASFAVLLAAAVPAPAAPPGGAEAVPITLSEAVRMAIERNLDLRVATFDPAVAEESVRRARGIYDPRFSLLAEHRGENTPLLPGSSLVERRRFFDADASLAVLLPTGATAATAFTNVFSRDSLGSATFRSAEPALALSVSQPLLQGFGREVTEREITLASYAKETSLADWHARAQDVAARARDLHFGLIRARENLETRKASLAAARQLHEENQGRVRAGILASVELLDSELGVALRETELLDAEKAVLDAADTLRVLIQYPEPAYLVPAETFPEEAVTLSEEEAVGAAGRNRPDIRRARAAVETEAFNIRVARNFLLPSLDLRGSVSLLGFDADYGDALGDLGGGDYPAWSVGLAFSYPIGNAAARADLAASRLRAAQARVALANVEENARLEIRTALRDLDIRTRQIAVERKAVALAETRLDSYVKRGRLGLARTKDILEVEVVLTAAREALTAARADYHAAVTRLWRSTGEILERQGIVLRDADSEKLARKEIAS